MDDDEFDEGGIGVGTYIVIAIVIVIIGYLCLNWIRGLIRKHLRQSRIAKYRHEFT